MSCGAMAAASWPLRHWCTPPSPASARRCCAWCSSYPSMRLTEICGVICRPQDHVAVVKALVEHFLARRSEWDVFPLGRPAPPRRRLQRSGVCPACSCPSARPAGLYRRAVGKSGRICASGSPSTCVRTCAKLTSCSNATLCVRIARHRGPGRRRYPRWRGFSRCTLRGRKRRQTPSPPEQIRAAARARLLRRLSAPRGRARPAQDFRAGDRWHSGRKPVAFLLGSDLYVHFTGYDPAWKTYRVMTVLVTEIIKWALARGRADQPVVWPGSVEDALEAP